MSLTRCQPAASELRCEYVRMTPGAYRSLPASGNIEAPVLLISSAADDLEQSIAMDAFGGWAYGFEHYVLRFDNRV